MIDPKLEPVTRQRIAQCDYDAVFTAGGCFIFALRLHERFGYKIRGIRSSCDPKYWGHVWAEKDGMGIDIRGMYKEDFLAALANGGTAIEIENLSVEDLRAEIAKKEYPAYLLEEIRKLADKVFDKHERFELAKPMKPEVDALFSKPLKN